MKFVRNIFSNIFESWFHEYFLHREYLHTTILKSCYSRMYFLKKKKKKKKKINLLFIIILLSRILQNEKKNTYDIPTFSCERFNSSMRWLFFFFFSFSSFSHRNIHPRIFLLVIPSAECKFNEYPPHFNHVSLIRRVILIFIKDTL